MAEETKVDPRRIPPLHKNMTNQERIACYRFLRALRLEAEKTVETLRRASSQDRPEFVNGTIRYWENVAAAYGLAMARTGIKE